MEARPLEKEVLNACLSYLHFRLPDALIWRQNQVAVPLPNGKFRRFVGLLGVADILGVLDTGRFLAVEVKRPGGKTSPHQQEFLGKVSSLGGVACCVCSVDELEADLREAGVI